MTVFIIIFSAIFLLAAPLKVRAKGFAAAKDDGRAGRYAAVVELGTLRLAHLGGSGRKERKRLAKVKSARQLIDILRVLKFDNVTVRGRVGVESDAAATALVAASVGIVLNALIDGLRLDVQTRGVHLVPAFGVTAADLQISIRLTFNIIIIIRVGIVILLTRLKVVKTTS